MASPQQTLLPPPTVINDTHKVYSIAAACIVLGVIAGITVLMRFGIRLYAHNFGPDDWAMIPASALYMGFTAMATYVNLHAGVGKPLWEITLGEYSVWFKGILGSAWLYPAMTAMIRISVLLFYHLIFATPQNHLRLVFRTIIALQVIYLIVYSILPAFICRPLHMAWHPLERQQYFNDWYYYNMQVALFSTSMAFDILLLVLPLYPVWQLQMPIKKRASIAVLFTLGAAASIVAAYKLAVFVIEMKRYTAINPEWLQYEMSTLIPPQFDTYGHTFWIPSQLEPTVAIIGTSLPAIRQGLVPAVEHFSRIWSRISIISTSRSTQSSKMELGAVQPDSKRSRPLVAPSTNAMRRSVDSDAPLHSEYTKLEHESRGRR